MTNASVLAEAIREAVIGGWREFRTDYPAESPYAFALIGGQCANYLGFAVATEEALRRVAAEYEERGYHYRGFEWEESDNREKLAAWLRWANPDDGWYCRDFPARYSVEARLRQFVEAEGFGEGGEDFEEFCTGVLASLETVAAWRDQMAERQVVVGFTYGEDPRDFLRTATRANRYPLVQRLWAEFLRAEEVGLRVVAKTA